MEQQLKKELTELFKDGYEEVYFRDTDKENAIMDRFKDKENDNVICFILCEYMPYEDTKVNLHYDECYGGSDELATIKTKYKLNHEWETNCIAYLYKDEELYEEVQEQLKIRRDRRIKFVNDHKEEIEKLKEQPTFHVNTPLAEMKVPKLKVECKIRDLKTGGKKSDLLARLSAPLCISNKAKKPYHPRLMFVAWLKRAAYMEFEDEEAEYQAIGKFYRGRWAYMDAYREYEDYFAIVVKAGVAFGAFDY